MAAEGEIETEVIVHKKGYEGFIFLMKWGAIISIVLGFIVILLIRE
jgi:Bacterial aa3 type cytochrome c oxidase subunit IV